MDANASNWMKNLIQCDCPFFQKKFFWENFYGFWEKILMGKFFLILGTFLIYAIFLLKEVYILFLIIFSLGPVVEVL
jgi:hypothetical protein